MRLLNFGALFVFLPQLRTFLHYLITISIGIHFKWFWTLEELRALKWSKFICTIEVDFLIESEAYAVDVKALIWRFQFFLSNYDFHFIMSDRTAPPVFEGTWLTLLRTLKRFHSLVDGQLEWRFYYLNVT